MTKDIKKSSKVVGATVVAIPGFLLIWLGTAAYSMPVFGFSLFCLFAGVGLIWVGAYIQQLIKISNDKSLA